MSAPGSQPLPWRETCARIRADHARLRTFLAAVDGVERRCAGLHPSFLCTALHRLSHHLFRRGLRFPARFFWHLNLFLSGADISDSSDIEGGLVIYNPPGVSIAGKAGRNLTVMACAAIGGEVGRSEDIGAGPGLSVLGDDVIMEPHSGVLGPIRIGNRVRIGAGVPLTRDVPDDTAVLAPEPRFLRQRD